MAGLSSDHVFAPAPTNDGDQVAPAPLEPAFPVERHKSAFPGMTLRDYFAGQVLAGMSAGGSRLLDQANAMRNISRACYEMADAMLKARADG